MDRQAEEIKKVEKDGWFGIDWEPMWDKRSETLVKDYLTNSINKDRMNIFLDTGKIDHLATFSYEMEDVGLGRFF